MIKNINRIKSLLPIMLVGGAVLLSSCASTTDIEQRYLIAPSVPHSTILLAAKTPDKSYQKTWESQCEKHLQKHVNVVVSHQQQPQWDGVSVSALIDANQIASAILLVDITALLLAPPQLPGQPDSSEALMATNPNEDALGIPDFSFFIGRKPKKQQAPPVIQSFDAQLLDTNGILQWDGLMETHEANDLKAIASSQCRALIKALQDHQFISNPS